MPNWKKEKKSRSVNDIPVEKKHDHIIHSLDDGAFQDLLSKVSQPSYCKTTRRLEFHSDLGSETNALVKVCEQGLRDEDAAKQEKKRKKAAFAFRNTRGGRNSCSRSISPEDIYMSRNTKPVEFDKMNLDYIDTDIEMADLSETTAQPMRYTKGNTEDTALELCQDDLELGEGGVDKESDFVCKANERQLQARGRVLLADESILPPQNEGMFSALSYDMIGTDELPTLSPSLMPLPQTAQRVHIPANGTFRSSDDGKSVDGSASAASAAALKREGRKKKKKEKEAKNTFFAENVKGYMGELPLDQLLNLIEGEPVPCESVKKQKGQQTTTESEDPVRKSRRRKSKEPRDIKEDAVSPTNLVTIGNHQDKAPLAPSSDQDLSPTLSIKSGIKEPIVAAVISANHSSNSKVQNVNNKISPKRRKSNGPSQVPSSENAGARIGRFSTEDAEEEFLSADEGVALSPGEEIMLSNAMMSSDVMLDGANYRADNEDVTIVERQATEEQEFITVSGKAKKKIHHQQTTRTGSSSNMKSERRSKATTEQRPEVPSQRRNSLEERVSSNGKVRRPTATSLADFIDEKKQENKAPAARNTTPPKRRVLRHERPESTADSELSYHDAPCDEMAPTAVNGTPSPERAFSYADAAKKSSDFNERGRDHSPSDSAKPCSEHINDISSKTVEIVGSQGTSGAELPNGSTSSTGLSFFYDENEATNTDIKPSDDNAFVLNLCGKTVRFAKGLATNNVEPNQRHLSMIELMTQRWESFLKGPAPMHYTAKTSPV